MNKQELIGKIKEMLVFAKTISKISLVSQHEVIKLIEQLDEPQKVVVPQFVDGYIKYAKEVGWNLLEAMKNVPYEDNAEFRKWFYKGSNVEVFARAWLDGYTVEKEKRYRVKVKGMNRINGYLAYNKTNGAWYFGISGNSKNHSTNHTRKELEEAGFGEVFNSPLFKVEEVEG